MIFSRCVLVMLIGTLLAGCGYQLRVAGGNAELSGVSVEAVSEPRLEAARRLLADRLPSSELQTPNYRLALLDEVYQKWPIAASPLDAVINYRVTLAWSLELYDGGGQLLGPLTVNTSDRFVEQRSNLLAAGEAEERRLNQLRDALADKLLRQIGFKIANMEPTASAPTE
jgi:outer membrane lipopolysaccharide assembly protein LptE/RlpB